MIGSIAGLSGPDLLQATLLSGTSADPTMQDNAKSAGIVSTTASPTASTVTAPLATGAIQNTSAPTDSTASAKSTIQVPTTSVPSVSGIVGAPSQAANGGVSEVVNAATTSPASAAAAQDWNQLAVGSTVNGGKVLDASVFQTNFLNPLIQTGGTMNDAGTDANLNFVGTLGSSANAHQLASSLGNDLSDSSSITLAGFKPTNFVTSEGNVANGDGGGSTTGPQWDVDAITAAAKAAGIDISKYTSAPTTSVTDGSVADGGGQSIVVPGTTDYQSLANDINKAAFAKAAADPNAIFVVDSQVVGSSSQLNRNNTAYVMRDDRLIPLVSNDYKADSTLSTVWHDGIEPMAAVAISTFLGPEVASYFGGGAVGAAGSGAVMGAANSAINGQNILKGALVGGLAGGVGSLAGSAVSGATGSATLGGIAKGVTGAAVSGVASGNGISSSNLALGAIGGANIGGLTGLDPATAGVINSIIKGGAGYALQRPH